MKKLLAIIVLGLLLIGNTYADNKVNLECSEGDNGTFMEPVLDFDNSLFYNSIGGTAYHMVFDDKRIQMVSPPPDVTAYKVAILEISRMTGSGKMRFYIVSDEEYRKIAVKFATRMRSEGLDNFDDKSFDFARRKIIVQTKIEHFKGKEVTNIVKFKCEKIEGKKF
jgi:hypothetical protein